MVRLVRYAGVSAVATTTSLVVLFVMVGMVRLPAVWSNVAATAVGTVPSFELNRRWVWGRSGRRSLMGQIVPFAVLSFTGLLVSTVAVGLVSGRTTGWSHWGHTVAVESANVAAYGSLWVAQYVLLDRVLFRSRGGEAAESDHGTEPTGPSPLTADRQTTPSWAGPVDSIVVSGARRPRAHDPRRE
jgi:putative flippase GtrA